LGVAAISSEMGVAEFNGVKFKATPGSKNIPFKLYSTSIDDKYIRLIYNLDDSVSINSDIIYLDFKNCSQGEILSDN
jgi:hypothetical protein